MLKKPALAQFASWCLPPGSFPYNPDVTSDDGTLGVTSRLARDRTSYRESDLDYEVTVFALDTRRVIATSYYSVSEDASGRRGSAPVGAAFGTEPSTVLIRLDDGTTEVMRY